MVRTWFIIKSLDQAFTLFVKCILVLWSVVSGGWSDVSDVMKLDAFLTTCFVFRIVCSIFSNDQESRYVQDKTTIRTRFKLISSEHEMSKFPLPLGYVFQKIATLHRPDYRHSAEADPAYFTALRL